MARRKDIGVGVGMVTTMDDINAYFNDHSEYQENEMHNVNIRNMFNGIEFEKWGKDIAAKAVQKIAQIEDKIKERETRIAKIRSEFKITENVLLRIIAMSEHSHQTMSYSNGPSLASSPDDEVTQLVPAGEIHNLRTEMKLIESERNQLLRLRLLERNIDKSELGSLPAKEPFTLNFEELEYLGF